MAEKLYSAWRGISGRTDDSGCTDDVYRGWQVTTKMTGKHWCDRKRMMLFISYGFLEPILWCLSILFFELWIKNIRSLQSHIPVISTVYVKQYLRLCLPWKTTHSPKKQVKLVVCFDHDSLKRHFRVNAGMLRLFDWFQNDVWKFTCLYFIRYDLIINITLCIPFDRSQEMYRNVTS